MVEIRWSFEMSEDPLISIVDDDTAARAGTRALVESLGYKAVSFSAAEHFLKSDMIRDTACLITDLQMSYHRLANAWPKRP
jgi:FixJ family two-component response regulator